MGITPKFTEAQIRRRIREESRTIIRAAVSVLIEAGEMCVNQARIYGSYTDQTGNLRSSVGYVVAVNGRVRAYSFEGDMAEGRTTGAAYARSLILRHSRGYVLIVVAGMKYAAEVEAKGRDVLKSAELRAEVVVPRLMRQLTKEINGGIR